MALTIRFVIPAVLVLVTVFTFIAHFNPSTSFRLPLLPSPIPHQFATFNAQGVTENRHLTSAECVRLFPELYLEADRATDWYDAKGGISKEDVDQAEGDGGDARLVILDNKLFVKAFGGSINSRTYAAMAAVYRTLLTSPEPLPDVDFVIQTADGGGGDYPHFVLDRRAEQEHLWLMPDFGFFSWPETGVGAYTEVRASTLAAEKNLGMNADCTSWDEKTKKLMWRGVPMVEVRQDLLRATRDKPWSDVRELNWGAVNQDEEGREKNNGDLKSPAEHCQYAFLAHVEGWAYSGRLNQISSTVQVGDCNTPTSIHPALPPPPRLEPDFLATKYRRSPSPARGPPSECDGDSVGPEESVTGGKDRGQQLEEHAGPLDQSCSKVGVTSVSRGGLGY